MQIIQKFITKNDCYKANVNRTDNRYRDFQDNGPEGLMLHSVGCNQPKASVFLRHWDKADVEIAVHGVIDGLDGNTYQALPWNYRGWHAGGTANNTHIGVEMGEPACIKYTGGATFTCSDVNAARVVAERTYRSAIELFAYLCKEYNLDPMKDGVIISHSEGHERGVASNHGDPEHLWKQLHMGYTMDTFRAAVKAKMDGATEDKPTEPEIPETPKPAFTAEETIWNFLKSKGLNDYAVAGIMGNLYAESALRPTNLQNSYEKKLDMTDAAYTKAVDDGSYDNFVNDSAGYGLAQWTYYSRKQNLLDFAREKGASIGELQMQLDFLWDEIRKYSTVMQVLNTATTVRMASDVVLLQYERPANRSEKVQEKRAAYGQKYFDKYADTPATPNDPANDGNVNVIAYGKLKSNMNIRKGPSVNAACIGVYKEDTFVEILQELPSGWLRIKVGDGSAYVSNTNDRYVTVGKELYTVVAGDSLWGISRKKLGNGVRYKEIKALNGLVSNLIHVNQKLLIP